MPRNKAVGAFLNAFRQMVERLKKGNITAFSAQAAFFIFISLVPFAMLLISLLSRLPISVESLNGGELAFISPQIADFIKKVISDSSQTYSGAIISVTTVVTLWSASKGTVAIVRGLDTVYGVTVKRNYIKLRLISLLYTFALVIILILTFALTVFGNSILEMISAAFPSTVGIAGVVGFLRWVVTLLLLVLFFMLIYTVVPERKTKFMNELPGAVVSSLGWVGFSALFSFYIDNFANYVNIYGSLATIVILLLWLYFCMIILFFGAELNDMLREVGAIGKIKARIRNKK